MRSAHFRVHNKYLHVSHHGVINARAAYLVRNHRQVQAYWKRLATQRIMDTSVHQRPCNWQ